jgi:hypothetical protein
MVILPKVRLPEDKIMHPLFFFAGPVVGGDDWQLQAYAEVKKRMDSFYAVIPYVPSYKHEPLDTPLSGTLQDFDRQLPWERHYLELAARPGKGCIMFWLPCECKTLSRTDGLYARDTRGELGEWRGRLMANPKLNVVIGAEPDFPGISVIERNFSLALGLSFPIHRTLEETVAAAIRKII